MCETSQLDEFPSVELRICNLKRVEAFKNSQLVGEAYRADVDQPWFVGCILNDRMHVVGRVEPWLPEVLQRKAVLAMLKAIT